jgi:hypothetical protein
MTDPPVQEGIRRRHRKALILLYAIAACGTAAVWLSSFGSRAIHTGASRLGSQSHHNGSASAASLNRFGSARVEAGSHVVFASEFLFPVG